MKELLEMINMLAMPAAAVGYVIVLERRLTRIETKVEMLLERVTGLSTEPTAHGKGRGAWL